jgi:hypothetical protein
MRLAAGVLSALVLVACGQAAPGASRSNAGTTPSASAAKSHPTPPSSAAGTLAGDLPVTTVDFSCRLPVVTWNPDVLPAEQGAFITFPASRLANDPNGAMVVRENGFATTVPPVLSGGVAASMTEP